MSLELLTPAEVAKELRISRRTLLRMRQTGRGPLALLIGGQLRYPANDFREFILERCREAVDYERSAKEKVSA